MIVTDAFCNGFLMTAIGAMGLMFAVSASAEEGSPEPDQSPKTDPQLEQLRAAHRVKLIAEKDEGTAIEQLPGGIYGFSYAPQQEAPLFGKKMFRNFEAHKLPDGSTHLIGYVKEADFGILQTGSTGTIHLFPDAYEQATYLVNVPMKRVLRLRGPARDHGSSLQLDLDQGDSTVN